jgi:hypothetical protein
LSDAPAQLDRSMRWQSRVVMFDRVVEKPEPENAPSDLAIIGRYLLTPDIFDDLDNISPGANGELQLTDALEMQAMRRTSSALISSISRRDIGNPLGWVQAVIDEALHHPRYGSAVRAWLLEEFAKDPHLGVPAFDRLRANADFGKDNEWHHQQSRLLEGLDDLGLPGAEVDEAVRIDQDSHFQSSGFVWSCSSSAACQAFVEGFGV